MEQNTSESSNKYLFESAPVWKAVVSLVIPTIISQLITVIYNMADTFFIGQEGDPNQVAAASICMPFFILLTGMANLFGIGGASLISRSLGRKDFLKAKQASAFSIWSAGTLAMVYGILIYVLRNGLLPLVGANSETYEFCRQYIFWVITLGAVPTVLSACLAHIVRSEGFARQASFGIAMGGILNMLLDPLFISVFGLGIQGAAVATFLSNIAATAYFIILILRKKDKIVLSMNPLFYTLKHGIPSEILLVGLPSALMNITGVLSNIFMNRLMASYCNEAVAGIGIAKKIDLLTYAIATGMSQAVIPLIGYNYSAKNYKRMMSAVKTDFILGISVAVLCTVFLLTGARLIVQAFIADPLTVSYGSVFQRIICLTGPCMAVSMIIITMFQSVGKKVAPLILSLLRKGIVDVPFMFLMNYLVGVNGIAWATPIADVTSMTVGLILFIPFWKKLRFEITQQEGAEELHA